MIKENHMQELQQIIRGKQYTIDELDELSITHSNGSNSLLSNTSPFTNKLNNPFESRDFGIEVYDDNPNSKLIHSKSEEREILNDSFEKLDLENEPDIYVRKLKSKEAIRSSANSRNEDLEMSLNSNKSKENIVVLGSMSSVSKLFKSMEGYVKVDYKTILSEIIKIQSAWRGKKARQFTSGLILLNQKAKTIQKIWRGWHTRITMQPIFRINKATIQIQRAWRQKLTKKLRAIIKIQRWYRNCNQELSSLLYEEAKPKRGNKQSKKSKFNYGRQANMTTKQSTPKAVRKQTIVKKTKQPGMNSSAQRERISQKQPKLQDTISSKDERSDFKQPRLSDTLTSKDKSPRSRGIQSMESPNMSIFSPRISTHSRELAEKKLIKSGNDYLSLEERFKIQENQRLEKIHNSRQRKIEEDLLNLTHSPKTNPKNQVKGTFLERQQEYISSAKLKISSQQINKADLEVSESTFSPRINKSPRSRNPDQTINDLYTWAKLKENQLKKAREVKADEETEDMAK